MQDSENNDAQGSQEPTDSQQSSDRRRTDDAVTGVSIPDDQGSYEPDVLPDGQSSKPHDSKSEGGSEGSRGAVIAAFLGNIAVGIVKFIAAAISGSSAMLSEGMHSMVDSTDSLLILHGMRRSQKKPDLEHPFGYSHELYFWTLAVAIMVFALGGGLSIYEGITHIQSITPDTVMGDPTVNYIVIAIAAVIEGVSLSVGVRNFNAARGDTSPAQFIREAKDPSLFTVVLEDSAAELGLIFAFLGVFLGHLFDNPYLDGVASLLIGLLLCSVSIILLRETKGLLIGEGLKASEVRECERIIESSPYVAECGRILSLYMGPEDLLLTADVTFKHGATADQIMGATDDIESRIVRRFPQTTRIFIESESLKYTRAQSVAGDSVGVSNLLPVDTSEPTEAS